MRVPGHRQEQIEQGHPVVTGEVEPCRKWTQLRGHYAWIVVYLVEDLPDDLCDCLQLVVVSEQVGDHSPGAGGRQAMQDEPVLVGHLSAV